MTEPLVQVKEISKHFPLRRSLLERMAGRPYKFIRAVHGVSIHICAGETLGLVGETGCGKSTLGRMIIRLYEPTAGIVTFHGEDITHFSESELRRLRSKMQIIFQDPYSSLNPRQTVREILSLPLRLHFGMSSRDRQGRIDELLQKVGLSPDHAGRYPHQFSGGQRQRIGIARALAVNPQFIVADEPVAALDVSVQAQILHLLKELQHELNLTILFISHDLAVVSHLSDRIAVMYIGSVVEVGKTQQIIETPLHPYTKCLLLAVPEVGSTDRIPQALGGEVPSALNPPPGCPFHPRCPEKIAKECEAIEPVLHTVEEGRQVACHLIEKCL